MSAPDAALAPPPEVLAGTRVRLRRSTPDDADALFAVVDDADVMRFLDWPRPSTAADLRRELEAVHGRWAGCEDLHWVLEDPADHRIIGAFSCRVHQGEADLGYFLGRSAWGRGVAREACTLVIAWATAQPAIVRVVATCDHENLASARLLERLGMAQELVLASHTLRPALGGPPRDTLVYVLPRDTAGIGLVPVGAQDWPAAWAIQRAAFQEAVDRHEGWTAAEVQKCADAWHAPTTRWVLRRGLRVGWVRLDPRADLDWLDLLVIAPAHQGAGLGAEVLDRLVADAEARAVPLWLSVHRDNPARRLYARRGFAERPRDDRRVFMAFPPQAAQGPPPRP
ncbi:MAG: GNAT family N-acetyltransferase [Alphaproteobacteria bacterium]|nr:GNAT family N-acetyltransferase [Alphaproteobacteria bacterium]